MSTIKNNLKDLIDQLPPELQQEVQDFVEFLLEKKVIKFKKEKRKKIKTRLERSSS